MSKINVAIIGSNFGLSTHLPAFRSVEEANVIAMCSRNIEKLKNTGVEIITNNYMDIMVNDNIHTVSIAVPPLEAFEIIKSAINHNKHIFLEKPLSFNLEKA